MNRPICVFAYARYSTRERAEEALLDMFAEGDVTEYEFAYIAKVDGYWCVMLREDCE